LVDVREDIRHLPGESVESGIVELEMREIGDPARFGAVDFHGGAILAVSKRTRVHRRDRVPRLRRLGKAAGAKSTSFSTA
jgi:hypothetical protein